MTEDRSERFLPEGIPEWQKPYWDSLRAHDVRVQRCRACGTYRYHPKEKCHRCPSREADWVPVSGHGEVYTYTIVRRPPTPAYAPDAPYAIVHVAMAEGFRMIATIGGIDPEQVRIGLAVEIAYDDVDEEWTLPTFRPRVTPSGERAAPATDW